MAPEFLALRPFWKVLSVLPFPTSYLREVRFSLYTSTKTTYPNRLCAEEDVKTWPSSLKPDFYVIPQSVEGYYFSMLLGKKLLFTKLFC